MNAVNLYISTCRLVMQADPDNKDTYTELYKLLPYLRQSLTCTVCGGILSDPFTPTETSCQHHVCKLCIGGKKRLKPSCSWCKDYETYIENYQMQVVVQCYKKLCSYVRSTCMYRKLSSIISNGGNSSITGIIDEAVTGEAKDPVQSIESNCESPGRCVTENCNINSTVMGPEVQLDTFDPMKYSTELSEPESGNIFNCTQLEPTQSVQLEPKIEPEENDIKENQVNLEEERNCISPLLTVDSSAISPFTDSNSHINSFPMVMFPETSSVSSLSDSSHLSAPHSSPSPTITDSALPHLSPIPTVTFTSPTLVTSVSSIENQKPYNPPVEINSNATTSNSVSVASLLSSPTRGVTRVYNSINVPLTSTLQQTASVINNHENKLQYAFPSSPLSPLSGYPPSGNVADPLKLCSSSYPPQTQVINPLVSSLEVSNMPPTTSPAISCVFNIPPGTILSSTNVKQSVRESLIKHGAPLNNGSSMYSVMYSNSESTKITIKRKPPDIENVKKLPSEKEKLAIPTQEVKKPKPKPKPKPKRKGCRCGNATPTPGKLTCCGQRCPCYVEAKACIECQCRGCRNPHRPGGKKVRPVIPQLGNIQIHQVQPVHSRVSAISVSHAPNAIHSVTMGSMSTQTPIMTSTGTAPQTIRAVHAMHAVQAVQGLGQLHSVPGGMHQLINIGGGIVDSSLASGININSDLALKPVNFALSSIPAQLLIHDDKSTSNSASDNSDIDIDI